METFKKKWMLLRHHRKVDCTKSKVLKCSLCKRTFRQLLTLNKHINTEHKEELGITFLKNNSVENEQMNNDGSSEESFEDDDVTDGEEMFLDESGEIDDSMFKSMIYLDNPVDHEGSGPSNHLTAIEEDIGGSQMDQTLPEGKKYIFLVH